MKALLLDRASMYIEEEAEQIKKLTCEHELESEWEDYWLDGDRCISSINYFCGKCGEDDYEILENCGLL